MQQPMDYSIGKHRGFGFVEYNDADDAAEAIFNMDGADLLGSTIRVSIAQPNQLHKLSANNAAGSEGRGSGSVNPLHQAVWSNDEWFQQNVAGAGQNSAQAKEEAKIQQQDLQILTESQ